MQFSGVKAVGIPGFGQQLFRFGRIVGVRLNGEGKLEGARDNIPRRRGSPQRFRLAQGGAVNGIVGRQPHPLIMPGGLGIPLVEVIQKENANTTGKGQL